MPGRKGPGLECPGTEIFKLNERRTVTVTLFASAEVSRASHNCSAMSGRLLG